jgi:hypothetical protein
MRPLPTVLLAAALTGLAALFAFSACAAPGVDIARQPGDHAFLEIALQG